MIQVRDAFQVRFGKIDQAVEHFQAFRDRVVADSGEGATMELLTDLSGTMYTLIASWILPSLAAWEQARDASFSHASFQEWFKPFRQYIEDGRRDFYTVEHANQGWSGAGAVVIRSCFRALEWRVHEAVDLIAMYGAMLVDCGVGSRPRVLTDASGPMFNVVIEMEAKDLRTWDEHRRTMFLNPQFQVWFQKLLPCVSHGSHEFYTVAG